MSDQMILIPPMFFHSSYRSENRQTVHRVKDHEKPHALGEFFDTCTMLRLF